jgi:hypothetical protein
VLAAIERSTETLRMYAWVARRFPPPRRRKWQQTGLSFTCFALVTAMEDAAEQDRWLDEAAAQGWTIAEMRDRLALRRKSGTRPPSLTVRAVGDLVGRCVARADALGMEPRDLALRVLDLAFSLDDPVGVLEEASGRQRTLEAPA